MDLITLDSPFQLEAPNIVEGSGEPVANHVNFEDSWNSFDASCDLRGWCNVSINNVTRRLQCVEHHRLAVIGAEFPPFIGKSLCDCLKSSDVLL